MDAVQQLERPREEAQGPTGDSSEGDVRALSVFAYSLGALALRAHADGPLRAFELEEALGWAPQSTVRLAVSSLCEAGALRKVESPDGPHTFLTELTEAGHALLPLADALEAWLRRSPRGRLGVDSQAARGLVRALVAASDCPMLGTIAERPLTLSELSRGIPDLSYAALKRRLARLRSSGLLEAVPRPGNGDAYDASRWLRSASRLFLIAGRWDRSYGQGSSTEAIGLETILPLGLPLVKLASRPSGSCSLAVASVEARSQDPSVSGVSVNVARGKVSSGRLDGGSEPTTWALGTEEEWLAALIVGRVDALRIGGAEPGLAQAVVTGLHETLFGA